MLLRTVRRDELISPPAPWLGDGPLASGLFWGKSFVDYAQVFVIWASSRGRRRLSQLRFYSRTVLRGSSLSSHPRRRANAAN